MAETGRRLGVMKLKKADGIAAVRSSATRSAFQPRGVPVRWLRGRSSLSCSARRGLFCGLTRHGVPFQVRHHSEDSVRRALIGWILADVTGELLPAPHATGQGNAPCRPGPTHP